LKFSLFAFQPKFPNVALPKENLGWRPIDTGSFQAPEIAPEPKDLDHTTEYVSWIADLKDRVKVLKQ
jgi:hypothetical protein